MSLIDLKNIRVDAVTSSKFHTTVDVLRLDLLHPVISGNKWFKLKGYLEEAKKQNKKTLITFGGAFSNHIVATAAAARTCGLKSVGIIRGEKSGNLSFTLREAEANGMKLEFISREDYKNKKLPAGIFDTCSQEDSYIVNEGGYGPKGVEGARDILKQTDSRSYTHILAAVGTGTTIAGLIEASTEHQQLIGISVMKNNFSLQQEIEDLLVPQKKSSFLLIHDYHFGGYAKHTSPLISFMNDWFDSTGIPTDFVYTGKLFYAVQDLLRNNYFPPQSKLLVIHSGGLQGNLSLPKGTLIF